MRINYSIIFVGDMDRSMAFYRDVLGIPVKFTSPGWSEFKTEGCTLALHKSGGDSIATADNSEAPGQCRAGFQVANLDEFHTRMMANNVVCRQEPTLTFGTRIAQYVDPDGMVLSVSESRTN